MPCRLPCLLARYLVVWVLLFDGFLPAHHLLLVYIFFELEGPCFSVSAQSGNFGIISMPADLSSSSPWTTLISSQPKDARKVLVRNVPPTVNPCFTPFTIREASGNLALPLILMGARCNSAHSASNAPSFGVAALIIRLLVA